MPPRLTPSAVLVIAMTLYAVAAVAVAVGATLGPWILIWLRVAG